MHSVDAKTNAKLNAEEEDRSDTLKCTFPGCSKTFVSRWSLTRHVRSHTGERPFTCNICGKSFVQKCSLNRHEQTHQTQKVWVCQHLLCGKKFKLKEYLEIHKRTHAERVDSSSENKTNSRTNDVNIAVERNDNLCEQLRERLIRMSIRHRRDMEDQRRIQESVRNMAISYEKGFRECMSVLENICPHVITPSMKEALLLPSITQSIGQDKESAALASTLTALGHNDTPANLGSVPV